jgi:hypothetical protein
MFLYLLIDWSRAVSRVESSRLQGLGAGHHSGHGKRGHKHGYSGFSFYVFGDSFADNGNLLKKYPNSELTRQWYPPYQASGRFSNLVVESDFIGAFVHDRSRSFNLCLLVLKCRQNPPCSDL